MTPNQPNPTDSLREQLRRIVVEPTGNTVSTADIAVGFRSSTDVETIVHKLERLIQAERQRLAEEILAWFPTKMDERPIDPETGKAFKTYGYEQMHNQTVESCRQAIRRCVNNRKDDV